MQRGEHGGQGRLLGLLVLVDRYSSSVVLDAHTAIGHQGDLDLRGVTGHCLVDRVIHNLPNEVMKTLGAG